ncbi:MAG: thioesterase family protein [Ruminococcus sp.]
MENFVIERTVTEDMLAVNVGSGSLRVLATPTVVALMEEASTKLADTLLSDEITTVGTLVNIEHISPSPVGANVRVESTLVETDGRNFKFEVKAFDDVCLIAQGVHNRVSVKKEKFQRKADEKLGKV